MLSEVILENFQCHKKLTLALSPGVNSIVGKSNAGKSAIIRALYWALLNKPSGVYFLRHGAKFVRVSIGLGATKLVRYRKKTKNVYRLGDKKFVSFHTTIPGEIQEETKISESNFQLQYDSPFWFCLSPGEVSKEINGIVDLSVIDQSQTYLSHLVREGESRVKVIKERIADYRKELAPIKKVPIAVQQFREIEAKREAFYRIRQVVKDLTEAIEACTKAKKAQSVKIPDFKPIDSLREKLRNLKTHNFELESMIWDCKNYLDSQKKDKAKLEEVEKELHKFEGVCPLCNQAIKH